VLHLQVETFVSDIPDLDRPEGEGALAYIYGFVDAALQSVGADMADMSLGVPAMRAVLSQLFPERAHTYVTYVADHLQSSSFRQAIQYGGQQFLDWHNGKLAVPMGLVRYLHGVDPLNPH
jgi:hypothetical protein